MKATSGMTRCTGFWLRAARMHLAALMVVAQVLAIGSAPAYALSPNEQLKDAGLEARARELSAELRCLVCQNQSIDDSDAPLAKDLRRLVRERLVAGDSNTEVKSFLVDRYGDFVLLKPPFGLHTLILWLGPAFVLLATIAFIVNAMRRRRVASSVEQPQSGLSADEEERLQRLLKAAAEDAK